MDSGTYNSSFTYYAHKIENNWQKKKEQETDRKQESLSKKQIETTLAINILQMNQLLTIILYYTSVLPNSSGQFIYFQENSHW